MKNKKVKKKKSIGKTRDRANDMPKSLKPFMKLYAKLQEPNITASDIRTRLKITQRQLNYLEKVLYPRDSTTKAKWHRYSIMDLLSLKLFLDLVELDLPKDMVRVMFFISKELIVGSSSVLIDIAKGKEIIVLHAYHKMGSPTLYTMPQEEELYLTTARNIKKPFIVFHLDSILRDGFKKTAIHDFSADIDDVTNKITFKIEGEKIRIDEIPDNLYKELNKTKT